MQWIGPYKQGTWALISLSLSHPHFVYVLGRDFVFFFGKLGRDFVVCRRWKTTSFSELILFIAALSAYICGSWMINGPFWLKTQLQNVFTKKNTPKCYEFISRLSIISPPKFLLWHYFFDEYIYFDIGKAYLRTILLHYYIIYR